MIMEKSQSGVYNEINLYCPKEKGIVLKGNSLDEISPSLLEFIQKNGDFCRYLTSAGK